MTLYYLFMKYFCALYDGEDSSILQLAYSNMKEEKTWIVMNNMRRYCSLGNMFELLKYGGNPLKMKFRVTHGVTVQNMTELL